MYRIVVATEPHKFRPLYSWRVDGPQLIAAGIALTEEEAWRQAEMVADGRAAA